MPDRRPFDVVVGYHDCTWPLPGEAAASQLVGRVAVVFSTYRPSSPDWVFDGELWLACLKAVSTCTASNHAELVNIGAPRRSLFGRWLWPCDEQVVGPLSNFRLVADATDEPPAKVRWYCRSELVAVAVTEYWCQTGGPMPYHDSYTLSCFVARESVNSLAEALEHAATIAGGELDSVIHGSAEPVR